MAVPLETSIVCPVLVGRGPYLDALIPVAHTLGQDFKPAPRAPLGTVVHWQTC